MRALISILLFSFSLLFSDNFYVETTGTDPSCSQSDPCGHIQTAINLTGDGDVVIVSGGTYLENLLIETGITLKSADGADPAIIDGSSPETDPASWNGGSCIVIRTPSGASSRVTATVQDITMTGGKGTDIIEDSNHNGSFSDPEDETKIVGGGMIVHKAGLTSRRNNIINNGDSSTKEGGAVYAAGTGIDIPDDQPADPPEDHFPNERLLIEFEETIFSDNNAQTGHTVMVNGWNPENQFIDMDFGNSQFDVAFDSNNNELDFVTEYWVRGKDNSTFDFTGGITGENDAIITDVWVNPNNGIDEGNTLGDQNNPFLTIDYAMGMIYSTEDNPVTIHLTAGEFSPTNNNEVFPIVLPSYVFIVGDGHSTSIIDAQGISRVMEIIDVQDNGISDLTITGGLASGENSNNFGGGVYLDLSNPKLTNVTISGNTATHRGGGMYLTYSNPILTNVTISGNTSSGYEGGGIYMIDNSNPILTNVTISGNTAYYGGGIYIVHSDPTLTNVTISENTANSGGGVSLGHSDPTLIHVTISGNVATNNYGGMFLTYSNPTLTNVIISGNTATIDFGGMYITESDPILVNVTISGNMPNFGGGIGLYNANPIITNSIIWNNSLESIYAPTGNNEPVITYSDIEGGWEGEGNISSFPLFADNPSDGDYTLQAESDCIDGGNPGLWYADEDGTQADMGATGGLYALPNFISHDFGEVGPIESGKQFNLYNYRETDITIYDVEFNTTSFSTTNTSFPMTIEPYSTGIISIEANNYILGSVQDEMELISPDLPEGIFVSLSVTGTLDNMLSGNLNETYPAGVYRINGDITIANDATVYLQPGTHFLFDGEYHFNIYGTLKAIGTEADSIIFDNYGDERWQGFTLDGVSDETEFRYVKISGANKEETSEWMDEEYQGVGMYLTYSNPTLANMTISRNTAIYGGGMYLFHSNPTLTNVTISENIALWDGGGMYLTYSNPILTNMTISGNTANYGGGMYLIQTSSTFINVTISENTANYGGGMYLNQTSSTFINMTISGNTANYSGGGIFIATSSSNDPNPVTLANVTISGNAANYNGGGIYITHTSPTLTNVTISGNTNSGVSLNNSNPIITNSIIWNNSSESIHSYTGNNEPVIIYSDIEGEWEGESNINENPIFSNPDIGDYTLQASSPCIDAGTADLDGDDYEDISGYCGTAPDMGAFEFITEDCEESTLSGDLNSDGLINVLDVVVLVNIVLGYGDPVSNGDLNGDGALNVLDVVALVSIILEG